MNDALEDEETSINAIYPDSFSCSAANEHEYTLHIAAADVTIRLYFPDDYPAAPPSIPGSASSGLDLKKGQATQVVEIARAVLADIFEIGQPCVFDLMQEIEARLPANFDEAHGEQSGATSGHDEEDRSTSPAIDPHRETLVAVTPPWVLSEVITEKKSVFVARAAVVTSREQAQLYVEHLLATDKKAAKATHNMTAWRIRSQQTDAVFQDCDDDGETAAGERLLHLLQLIDVWNVMVVVTRWYGGVHLGPDRFRFIKQAAQDALVKSGLVEGGQQANIGKKKKK